MTVLIKCRASVPSNCRVHGSKNPVDVLLNPVLAIANLRSSEKQLNNVAGWEEYLETKELIIHDRLVYDATLEGLTKLYQRVKPNTLCSRETRVEIQRRITEALEYREQVLGSSSTFAEAKEKFVSVVSGAKQSFMKLNSKNDYSVAFNALKDLPYGTPVAVKLKNGGYLYDEAGNGLNIEFNRKENKGFLERILGNKSYGFIHKFKGEDDREGMISLMHSNVLFNVRAVEEIHVLDKAPNYIYLKNTHGDFSGREVSSHGKYWGVQGDGYYYEFEGASSNGDESEAWAAGTRHNNVYLRPHKPEDVFEIKV